MIAIGKSINFDLSFIQPLDSNEKANEEAHKETKQSSRKKKDVHYNIPLDFDNVLDSTIHNTIPRCLNIEIDLTKLHETEEGEDPKEVVDNYKSNLHLSQIFQKASKTNAILIHHHLSTLKSEEIFQFLIHQTLLLFSFQAHSQIKRVDQDHHQLLSSSRKFFQTSFLLLAMN